MRHPISVRIPCLRLHPSIVWFFSEVVLWLTIVDHARHRLRESVVDEDGPPAESVVDLVTEIQVDPRRQVCCLQPS